MLFVRKGVDVVRTIIKTSLCQIGLTKLQNPGLKLKRFNIRILPPEVLASRAITEWNGGWDIPRQEGSEKKTGESWTRSTDRLVLRIYTHTDVQRVQLKVQDPKKLKNVDKKTCCFYA